MNVQCNLDFQCNLDYYHYYYIIIIIVPSIYKQVVFHQPSKNLLAQKVLESSYVLLTDVELFSN